MEKIPSRRDIIDRKKVTSSIEEISAAYSPNSIDFRNAVLKLLKETLKTGRTEIKRRFMENNKGRPTMHAGSYLMDQIVRIIYDVATVQVFPLSNPTSRRKTFLAGRRWLWAR